MSVRTAYVGTQVAGDTLTAANFSKLPGGWLGYAEVTANQGSITTVADLTSLSVAVTVGTSRRLRITGHGVMASTVAGDVILGIIQEGASQLGRWAELQPQAANGFDIQEGSVILTPTSGAHTYKLTLQRAIGTGSVTLLAAGGNAAFILCEDIGPAS